MKENSFMYYLQLKTRIFILIFMAVKDENLSDFKWRVSILKCILFTFVLRIHPCLFFSHLKNIMWNSPHYPYSYDLTQYYSKLILEMWDSKQAAMLTLS